ncbi:uncharacterized protein LOC113559660, partial [Rhopalosiphum maidis]|uniref:uncharacterized protein LOC113559660 n=1 Tax=Rhopalosiphum maidis TaxID=43146 RepID=UPI000F000FD8
FDIDDKVLIIFKNKKNVILKMELSKETGEPMEVEEPTVSPSNVHNNHINKKKQSKSSKPNDIKDNWSNKRHKKDNTRSDTLEPLKLHVPPSLELTTPTFNLTSSYTRTRRSTASIKKSDVSNAIFKIPFEHGWKRELVYRTPSESAVLNRAHTRADVYYHSPNNQKLRSLREIQELLNISSDKSFLTTDYFTFVRKPIGVNDRSKELIRNAHFKSFKTSSRLRSKKGNSESMDTSSSTPKYISEDQQAVQSSISTKVSPKLENIDINTTIMKKRTLNSEGKLELKKLPKNCPDILLHISVNDQVMKSSFDPKDNCLVKILGLH